MRRRLLVLVLTLSVTAVTAVTAGTAVADADPVGEGVATDACRDSVGEPQQVCDAVRSATHGGAALCRQGGAPDVCTPLNGQRVAADEVLAYADSPTAAAHALQRRLQEDLPFRDATFVATHNSYNSYAYRPTLSGMDANQTYSLVEQLEMDARRLELDIHSWVDATTGEQGPILCHATDDPIPHTGCTAERPLRDGLVEIDGWLDDHPDEIVMLRLETHLDGAEGYEQAAAALMEVLGDHLFLPAAPAAGGDGCAAFDLDMSRADIRAAGAQVLLVSDCGQGEVWPGLVWDDGDVRVESTARDQDFSYPTCAGIPRSAADGGVSYQTRWIRFWDDATLVSSMSSTGGPAPARVTPEIAREWTRCGVNQPSFDHLTPTDGRLEALVWTWADGEGTLGTDESCAVALAGTGRFASVPCDGAELRPALCRTAEGLTVTDQAGPITAHDGLCRTVDGSPAVPRSGYEAQLAAEALAAAGADDAWIALVETDGGWTVPTR